MTSSFENKIDSFIQSVKTYRTSDDRFNPWTQTDNSDFSIKASDFRCKNLRRYILDRPNPKYILLGESPSIGARYTGIPMTSENIINLYTDIFSGYKCTSKLKNTEEKTANIVWAELLKYGQEKFVIWNSYAFNSKDNISWYRKASTIEKKEKCYCEILLNFFEIYSDLDIKIIAVGRDAEKACKYIGLDCDYVRHPSHGGIRLFKEQLNKIIVRY